MIFGRKYWLGLALCLALQGAGQVSANLVVLHTNDVHCGVENQLGYAQLAQYKKDLMKNPDDTVQLVDAGDAIQGEPLGSLTRGQAVIDIMNVAGYDFAIPGNHEFDYGVARLLELAPQLAGGYYSCNLVDLRTGKTVFPPYKMVAYDGGKKAAFIGVTTPQTLISSTPRYFQDDKGQFIYGFSEDATGQKLYEQVQKAIDQAWDEGARTIILVTHLGQNGSLPVWTSEALAAHTQKVAAIIDGHSHEQYERLVKNRKGQPVLIAQTGTKFQSVGKLVIDDYGHVRGELVTQLDGADAAIEAVVQREMAVVREQLQQPVATLPVDFVTDIEGQRRVRNGETNLADLAVDAIRYRLHTDVALLNGGSFRAPLSAGIVTYESLYRVFPFSNQLVVCSVTGQQLLDALEMGASRYPQEFGGFLQVSGLTYRIDPAIPSSVVLDDKGRFVKVAGPRRVKETSRSTARPSRPMKTTASAVQLTSSAMAAMARPVCKAASCWKIRACPMSTPWQRISPIRGTPWLLTMATRPDRDGLPPARKQQRCDGYRKGGIFDESDDDQTASFTSGGRPRFRRFPGRMWQ